MYEEKTFDALLKKMLDKVPNSFDKREGSVIYDALAPAAIELGLLYAEADYVLNQAFGDTCEREYLILHGKTRGLFPYPASNTFVMATFNINVSVGDRFYHGDIYYVVFEKISDLTFKLKCEAAGSAANEYVGEISSVLNITGLTSACITEILVYGEDEEETEKFRKRYLQSFNSNSFGGNISDYKKYVEGIGGTGGCKVIPFWNGGGTVKIILISSDFSAPSSDFVNEVQEEIDPKLMSGEGLGIAPIGHKVTVFGVLERVLNISASFVFENGCTFADIKEKAQTAILEYVKEVNKGFAESTALVFRISHMETRLLSIDGILDVSGTEINGVAQNLILDMDEIGKLGEINAV